MFRIVDVKIKGWCQHSELSASFIDGANGIVGPNGKGKSNLLSAVYTAVTGRMLTGTIEDNINFEADAAEITVDFVQNGVAGTVKRVFTAKRIDGHANRDKAKSTASLKFGEDKTTGASKVTEEMTHITGMTPFVIENHVFVTQGKIDALLFQPKGERLKSFLSLIPAVAKAEILRVELANELGRFQEIEVATNVDETKASVAKITAEIADEELRLEACKSATPAETDMQDANSVLLNVRVAQQAEMELPALQAKIATQNKLLTDATVNLSVADTQAAALNEIIDALKPKYEAAKVELTAIANNNSVLKVRQTSEQQLAELTNQIVSKGTPDDGGQPWKGLPEWEKALISVSSDMTAASKLVNVLQAGGQCPTCGNKFINPEQELANSKAIVAKLSPIVLDLTSKIRDAKNAKSVYDNATASYMAWLDSSQARLESLQKTLDTLPVVTAASTDHIADLNNMIKDYDSKVVMLRQATQESVSHNATINSSTAILSSLQDTQVSLAAKLAAKPSAEHVASAMGVLKMCKEINEMSASLTGGLMAKRSMLSQLQQELAKMEATVAKATATRAYRQLLEEAREVFHRERLPAEVLAASTRDLDSVCNKFLDMFGNPFAVQLMPDMELVCLFPSGYNTVAERLSGGQKCVLSVAMRFAINELFARDLGLLALDEPCSYMDDDNVEYMKDVITRINEVGKSTGVQTMVITHHKELIPGFESVIRVGY